MTRWMIDCTPRCERSHGIRRGLRAVATTAALTGLLGALSVVAPGSALARTGGPALAEHGQCPTTTPATASTTTPGAPIDVHAIGGNGSATVTWCPASAGQAHVTGYTVTGSDGQTWTASVPNDYAIATVPNGQAVSFTVKADSTSGTSPASAQTNTVTPAPIPEPTDVLRGAKQSVSYDKYSLMIGGRRTFIYSGEFDPWRLPSPSLWLDRLEKMKADGYNAVTPYFDWDYTSPRPGVYDFGGVRDMNEFLNLAQKAGLYVIARPGPYINAETDGGGFPGWLVTQSGVARTDAPDFVAASDQWLSQIDPIIAAHQITRGGDVILYQTENELYDNSPTTVAYMQELRAKAKADGIDVPLIGNESDTFQNTPANTDIPGYDSYPLGFNCSDPTGFAQPPGFTAEPGKPLELPEFQGGSYDSWGGAGYDDCYDFTGPDFENVFYKSNLSQGTTIQSNYMAVGGTNWGWLPAPFMYSSYDYGAGIRETGEIGTPSRPGNIVGSKYGENKLIGDFALSQQPLTETVPVAGPVSSNPLIAATARANPTDGTQYVSLRQADATSTQTESTHLALDLGQTGSYTYDDTASALQYTGSWSHVSDQSYTGGDYDNTESFSDTTGDAVSVTFDGTAVQWIAPTANNHGIADVYLDGKQVATVDGYAASNASQQVEYEATGLAAGQHTLKIVVSGQKNPASSGTFVSVDAINVPTAAQAADIYPTVPQAPGTAITLQGRDAKLLVADEAFDGQQLQYSTSEMMTHMAYGSGALALLYGNAGTDGETVLRYASRPTVSVLAGHVSSSWDPARGDLRLDYVHAGLAEVRVTGGGRPPLLALIASTAVAQEFWPESTATGPALVQGGYLVRTASASGRTLALTGDTTRSGPLTVWAPSGVSRVTWDGRALATRPAADGSLHAQLGGAVAVVPPALTGWRFRYETPEAQPAYDDSTWTLADHPTTTNPTKPVTLPVLYADDYGFHQGFIWYRGHFSGDASGVTLTAGEGSHGAFSVWLNGVFLGSNTAGSESAQQTFSFPQAALRRGGHNVVAVLVQSSGHDEDGVYSGGPADGQKAPRGLLGATLEGSSATVTWRLQGAQGGSDLQDPVRGPLNASGLYGSNAGWDLPGDPNVGWRPVSLPDSWTARGLAAGVGWYRTTFALHQGAGYHPLAVQIGGPGPGPGAGAAEYRAFIYVNGWLLGQYDNALGPQHRFYIPDGILRSDGENTVAIAAWGLSADGGGLARVRLVSAGDQSGGVPVSDVSSPGWNARTYGAPTDAAPTLGARVSSVIASPGSSRTVVATLGDPGTAALRDVRLALAAPAGWTVSPAGPVSIGSVAPGGAVRERFRVTAPSSGLSAGPVELVVRARYRIGGGGGVQRQLAGAQLQVPEPSLAASFDNVGITDQSDVAPGGSGFAGFDGEGTTFSAQGLATTGVTPGSTVSAGGLSFTWPSVAAGTPDNTMAQGQLLSVSGSGSRLGFLAAANNAALSGTGTVYYTDGSTSTFTLDVGNFYYAPGSSGNPANTVGVTDPTLDYPTGPTSHTSYVFEQTVAIDPGKTVAAVGLPSLGDVSGYNPALHVFGVAIGS